jgi:RND family efflux transporter MFP subunit
VWLEDGQARAELDGAKARVLEVEAELRQARRQSKRLEGAPAEALTAVEREGEPARVQALSARHALAEAEVRQKEIALAHKVVAAPFSGVVTARHVDPGAYVQPGARLLTLAGEEVEVHVDVSADLLGRVAEGGPAEVLGPEGEPAKATVVRVVGALDPVTRTARVRLFVPERPAWLVGGRPVEVAFEVEAGGEGLVVPRAALVRGPVSTRVVKVVDMKAEPVDVRVLVEVGDDARVEGEGLAPGAAVVVRGNERLRPGQPLRVAESTAEAR